LLVARLRKKFIETCQIQGRIWESLAGKAVPSYFSMKSLFDQLSPSNRYYLGKLLKKAGRSYENSDLGSTDAEQSQFAKLTSAQISQLENLLYFHQTLSNQQASSTSNLEQVTGLIFALLNSQPPQQSQDEGFGRPSLSEEQLVSEGLVDKESLMQMPLQELETLVEQLRKSLGTISSFVNEQEEELGLQQQAVDKVKQQLSRANEYESMILEAVLVSEQQSYDFLDAALVGQRQRIQVEQQLLQIHQNILRYRQES
jgi:hypothetical protein